MNEKQSYLIEEKRDWIQEPKKTRQQRRKELRKLTKTLKQKKYI